MWGSSESEDKGADLDTLMCLLILSFIVDLRISTRLFTFLFFLQHEAQGSGLLRRYVTATFFHYLFLKPILHFSTKVPKFSCAQPTDDGIHSFNWGVFLAFFLSLVFNI